MTDVTIRSVAFLVSGAMILPIFAAQGQVAAAAAEVEAREIAFAQTMADRDLDAFRSAHTGSGGLTRVKN